ncbi:hypothetical protein CYMTET_12875 [Cymbomonas tetramitiformis]|uniref:Uncharacterized protein n=1 Tax=Cymbomonas tetramitiformis TaxID=36881 RepID=A0AAE0GJK7_9CHLO|nr:hypothetical protein CYMTET_12875 [Cymbomonas tetramitiformis]
MGQQQLNTEGLLGRFFPREVLADHAESVSKSPKGSSAVLAARISTHWLKTGSVAAKGDGAQKANTETALANAESDQAKAQRGN